MDGYNIDLQSQMEQFENIIMSSTLLKNILLKTIDLDIHDYYIGAGCIAQTIWNKQLGNNLDYGISDIDFVYFDNIDLSVEGENKIIDKINNTIKPCPIKLDIKNQARVHLWYKEHFGYNIKQYKSIEDAINSWPTTSTSIGIRLDNGKIKIYAPFGLNDIFGMIIKANKAQITEEIYLQKVNKWKTKWSKLKIIPW